MSYLSGLLMDFRFALRGLRKDLRFAALAIVALALGIGATTVIFSVINGILLEPYPFRDADRLAAFYIHDVSQSRGNGRDAFTVPEFVDFREQNHVFEDVFGFGYFNILYPTKEGTQLFNGGFVTGNVSDFLGMKPLLGRPLTPEDAQPDAPPVFAMTDRLWAKQFNRDPKIVGTTMVLNDTPRTLVEIMPPRFIVNDADILIPLSIGHSDIISSEVGNFPIYLVARERLKRGVSLRAATADLDVIARRLSTVYAKDYPKRFTVLTKSLPDADFGDFKGMLYALLGAVLMLLLIACSNIANLLLARATVRAKEFAIRTSLGASRGRLIRQFLVESFVLSAGGCILGCLLAYFGLKKVVAAIPADAISPSVLIKFDTRALLFAIGVTMLTTLLCGLAPAIHVVRGSLPTLLNGTGKGAGGNYGHGKLRAGLVIGEVALAILLLAGAGLMMRTLFALEHVDLGFNPKNVLSTLIAFPKGRYDTAAQKSLFFRQVFEHISVLPGVKAATVAISLPPFGGASSEVTVPGKTHAEQWNADLDLCAEGYFRTLGLRLLRGRLLSEEDVNAVRYVIVVNESLARKFFTDEDPIGKTIKFNFLDQLPDLPHDTYFEIIGVIADAKNHGLKEAPVPEAFMPYTVTGAGTDRALMIRTATEPLAMLPSIRREISSVDSGVALTFTGSLEGFLQRFGYAVPEFGLITLGVFAGIGLVLVLIGVFSVMAYSVSLQTHEIGVRMALGALPGDVMAMVIKRGLALVAAGIVVGLLASWGLTRFLASQIWGVSATDPWTFAAVVVVILAVGVAACWVPARRGTKVDPLIALRYE